MEEHPLLHAALSGHTACLLTATDYPADDAGYSPVRRGFSEPIGRAHWLNLHTSTAIAHE